MSFLCFNQSAISVGLDLESVWTLAHGPYGLRSMDFLKFTNSLALHVLVSFILGYSTGYMESQSGPLRKILSRFLESTSSSQSPQECPGMGGLTCTPGISHCPYSQFGEEEECIMCDVTCDPKRLTSSDRISYCFQQCQGIYIYF